MATVLLVVLFEEEDEACGPDGMCVRLPCEGGRSTDVGLVEPCEAIVQSSAAGLRPAIDWPHLFVWCTDAEGFGVEIPAEIVVQVPSTKPFLKESSVRVCASSAGALTSRPTSRERTARGELL